MDILGLNPIFVVVAATGLGITLRVVLGIVFEIPATADTQTVLVLIVGSVAAVMGSDAALRSSGKIAQDKIVKI